ncbi:hypothetical protein [Saccharopolyspora spinosa]
MGLPASWLRIDPDEKGLKLRIFGAAGHDTPKVVDISRNFH